MNRFWFAVFLILFSGSFAQENSEGLTPLMQAVLNLDDVAVTSLLKSGVDVNERDERGETALMKIPFGRYYQPDFIRVFEMLLEAGGDVALRDNDGATALMFAALYCQPLLVNLYVNAGSDVNAVDAKGYTPLMFAMNTERRCYVEEYRDVVYYLLEHGANVQVSSSKGLTPLMQAANLSWLEMVEKMVEKGAEVNTQTRGGSSALSLAIRPAVHPVNIDARVIHYLLDQGADPTTDAVAEALLHVAQFPPYDLTIVEVLAKAGANINYWPSKSSPYPNYTFPLITSVVKRQDGKVLRVLIQQGADLEVRDDSGRTPLLWAGLSYNKCLSEFQGDGVEIIRLLVEGGANVNVRATPPDDWKDVCESSDTMFDTPLLQATKRGDVEAVKLLVSAGATVEAKDSQGWTALDFAVQTQQEEIVEVLLEASRE